MGAMDKNSFFVNNNNRQNSLCVTHTPWKTRERLEFTNFSVFFNSCEFDDLPLFLLSKEGVSKSVHEN